MKRLLAIALLLCACASRSPVDDALRVLSDREIFPMSDEEVVRLLDPIGGRCRGERLRDGFSITCAARSPEEAKALLQAWLVRFEAELDPKTLTADEKRNGALLRARVEGNAATIAFHHDPGLEGLMH